MKSDSNKPICTIVRREEVTSTGGSVGKVSLFIGNGGGVSNPSLHIKLLF